MAHNRWSRRRLRSESAYWRSCVLITAAHLALFTWLGKRQKDAIALVAHFGGSPVGWEIFCNALCAMGLLRKRGKKYANSAFSLRRWLAATRVFCSPSTMLGKDGAGLPLRFRAERDPRPTSPFSPIAIKRADCWTLYTSTARRSRL